MGSNPPGDTIGLEDLNDAELDKEINMRALHLRGARGMHWDAVCEKMVRQVKGLFPEAAYLGLAPDSSEAGDFYNLVEVTDAKGKALSEDGMADERFWRIADAFASDYSGVYEGWFTVDDRAYFSLDRRQPLRTGEFERLTGRVTAAEVAG